MILRYGISEEHRPNAAVLASSRAAVQGYLDTLESAFVQPARTDPPLPNLATLRRAGVSTVTDEQFRGAVGQLEGRRRQVLGLVQDAGWDWPG